MKTKLFKSLSLSTIIVQIIMSIMLVSGIHNMAMAQTPSPVSSAPDTSKFNVSQYLTANGQGHAYLNSNNPIASFIIQIINFLVLTIGSVCFLAIIIGGFILMTSNGNENSLTKGKDIIKFALIGLGVSLSAYIITAFVQSLFYELPSK